MLRSISLFIVVSLTIGCYSSEEQAATNFPETIEKFSAAYFSGDSAAMAEFCCAEVQVLRNPRDPAKKDDPNHTPKEFSNGYASLINVAGKSKWAELSDMLSPTITVVTQAGNPLPGVKPGDQVLDMRFREGLKGKRRGLDEAVLFVFREELGKVRMVIHYADY